MHSKSTVTRSIHSNMTQETLNTTTGITCFGSNLPAKFVIRNIGNTRANITIRINETASSFLSAGGNNPEAKIHYLSANGTLNGGCDKDPMANWYELAATGSQPDYIVCGNMSSGTPKPTVDVFLNVTIPTNAKTSDTALVGLTFWAQEPTA
jgi:hypothetical protein